MPPKMSLKVNGKVIFLNPFVQKMIDRVIAGILSALDEIPQPIQQVELVINTIEAEKKQA